MREYDELMARQWADAYDAGEDSWSRSEDARRISATVLAALTTRSRVLDVGTGRGVDVARYAEAGHDVTGIDVVALPDWAEIAKSWPSAQFVQCNLLDHVTTKPYDVVVDAGCFHHQHPRVLAEYLGVVRRHLRAGGTYWLATLQPREMDNRFSPSGARPDPDGSYTLSFTSGEISRLLRGADFEVMSVTVVHRSRSTGLDDLLVRATARGPADASS